MFDSTLTFGDPAENLVLCLPVAGLGHFCPSSQRGLGWPGRVWEGDLDGGCSAPPGSPARESHLLFLGRGAGSVNSDTPSRFRSSFPLRSFHLCGSAVLAARERLHPPGTSSDVCLSGLAATEPSLGRWWEVLDTHSPLAQQGRRAPCTSSAPRVHRPGQVVGGVLWVGTAAAALRGGSRLCRPARLLSWKK